MLCTLHVVFHSRVFHLALCHTSLSLLFSVSFEDKLKENFARGSAELEKRRLALEEAQRKERERRDREEREAQERREREAREQENRRRLEEERRLERQRQREEERLRELERKEVSGSGGITSEMLNIWLVISGDYASLY